MRFLFVLFLGLFCNALWGFNPQMLKEYLPVAKLFQENKINEAIARCEKLAPQNVFAANTLALIYSRGYYNRPVNYQQAGRYLDMTYALTDKYEMTDKFWDIETMTLDQNVPTLRESTITCFQYDTNSKKDVRATVALKGKEPRLRCYLEKILHSGGGLGAQILMLESETQSHGRFAEMRREAIRLGNHMAILYPFDPQNFKMYNRAQPLTRKQFNDISKSADVDHVPSMILVALMLQGNSAQIPIDYGKAREYLIKARAICDEFQKNGCAHVENELAFIDYQLLRLPDPAWTLEEVRKKQAFLQANRGTPDEVELLSYYIARNNPDYGKFIEGKKLISSGNQAPGLAMMKQAARANIAEAIDFMINFHQIDEDSWYWFYLKQDYSRALELLQRNSANRQFPVALVTLSKVYPPAKQELEQLLQHFRSQLAPGSSFDAARKEIVKKQLAEFELAMGLPASQPVASTKTDSTQKAATMAAPFVINNSTPTSVTVTQSDEYDHTVFTFAVKANTQQSTVEIIIPDSEKETTFNSFFDAVPDVYQQCINTVDWSVTHLNMSNPDRKQFQNDTTHQPRLSKISVNIKPFNQDRNFQFYLCNDAKLGVKPQVPLKVASPPTAEEAKIFAAPSPLKPQVEFPSAANYQVSISPADKGFDINAFCLDDAVPGEILVFLPDMPGKLAQIQFPYPQKELKGKLAILAFLAAPDQVKTVPIIHRPTQFYSRLHALLIKPQFATRTGFTIKVRYIEAK